MVGRHLVRNWYEASGFQCESRGTVFLASRRLPNGKDITVPHHFNADGLAWLDVLWDALDAKDPALALEFRRDLTDRPEDFDGDHTPDNPA